MIASKQHFEMIARVLREADLESSLDEYQPAAEHEREIIADDRRRLAHTFADELTATNPRFDRARFLRACGVES